MVEPQAPAKLLLRLIVYFLRFAGITVPLTVLEPESVG
jgi:hypothetical protein